MPSSLAAVSSTKARSREFLPGFIRLLHQSRASHLGDTAAFLAHSLLLYPVGLGATGQPQTCNDRLCPLSPPSEGSSGFVCVGQEKGRAQCHLVLELDRSNVYMGGVTTGRSQPSPLPPGASAAICVNGLPEIYCIGLPWQRSQPRGHLAVKSVRYPRLKILVSLPQRGARSTPFICQLGSFNCVVLDLGVEASTQRPEGWERGQERVGEI